jgi:hypothetical protein
MKVASIVSTLAGASLLAAACGPAAVSPGVASIGSTTTTVVSASRGVSGASLYTDELKYARCMRTHGVANFPDPNASGGFTFPVGTNPTSSASRAAQATCRKYLPGGGMPGPGTTTHPTAAALAQMLRVTQCMRHHGIYNFPDPATSMPTSLSGVGVVSDRDGVIFVFPRSLNMQSSQFTNAAAACKFPLTNH